MVFCLPAVFLNLFTFYYENQNINNNVTSVYYGLLTSRRFLEIYGVVFGGL